MRWILFRRGGTRSLGMLILGLWLILTGLLPLLHLSFPDISTILDVLAVAAGALILLDAR